MQGAGPQPSFRRKSGDMGGEAARLRISTRHLRYLYDVQVPRCAMSQKLHVRKDAVSPFCIFSKIAASQICEALKSLGDAVIHSNAYRQFYWITLEKLQLLTFNVLSWGVSNDAHERCCAILCIHLGCCCKSAHSKVLEWMLK